MALLSSAANDTVPSVQELTTAAQNMGSAMKEAGTDYDTTLSSMEATASVADQYIGKLDAIEAATGGNTAGNTEYHDPLARLSALVPSLADDIVTLKRIPSRAAPKPCASTQTLMWPMQRRKPGRTI